MRNWLLLCIALLTSSIAFAQQEKIYNYDVNLSIDTARVLTVTEKITVQANGNQIKRGIFRSLPIKRKDIHNQYVPIAYELVSVEKDGQSTDFHTKESAGNFSIYIGSSNVFLQPGKYTYTITYKTWGQLGFYDEYDEIYWNVTGNEWSFPIDQVRATVELPNDAEIIQQACYTGYAGSTAQDCQYSETPVPTFTASNLRAAEGLTIAVGFEKGAVNPPPPPTFWDKYKLWIISLGSIFLLLVYYYFSWNKYGRDPEKPTVYPIYEPPEELSPAGLGSIHSDRLRYDLISASIINIAVNGNIEIEEVEKSNIFSTTKYKLKKVNDNYSGLSPEEKGLMKNLFKGGDTITMDGTYDSDVSTAKSRYNSILKSEFKNVIHTGRNYHFLFPPIIFSIAAVIFMAFNTQYTAALGETIGSFMQYGIFALIFLFSFFPIIFRMIKKSRIFGLVFLVIIAAVVFFMGTLQLNMATYIIIGFVLFALTSVLTFRYLINQPTEEKLRLQSLVEGFKMYMSAAENNQIKHFNPPKMTPEVFESLLPYAIALKVDKIWGEKFQRYLQQANISNYNSTWYHGYSSFNSDFPRTLNNSVNKSVMSTSTKPSQSGGSYSSGSGGGGFSGGGGGGGGGGGW